MLRIDRLVFTFTLLLLAAAAPGLAAAAGNSSASGSQAAYSDDEVVKAANDFFKNGAADLGKVLTKVCLLYTSELPTKRIV